MQTGQRIVAMVFSVALCLATNTGLSAAESWSPVTMKPLMAVNLDARTKDVVSYFLSADGQCKLTLMIAENLRRTRPRRTRRAFNSLSTQARRRDSTRRKAGHSDLLARRARVQ